MESASTPAGALPPQALAHLTVSAATIAGLKGSEGRDGGGDWRPPGSCALSGFIFTKSLPAYIDAIERRGTPSGEWRERPGTSDAQETEGGACGLLLTAFSEGRFDGDPVALFQPPQHEALLVHVHLRAAQHTRNTPTHQNELRARHRQFPSAGHDSVAQLSSSPFRACDTFTPSSGSGLRLPDALKWSQSDPAKAGRAGNSRGGLGGGLGGKSISWLGPGTGGIACRGSGSAAAAWEPALAGPGCPWRGGGCCGARARGEGAEPRAEREGDWRRGAEEGGCASGLSGRMFMFTVLGREPAQGDTVEDLGRSAGGGGSGGGSEPSEGLRAKVHACVREKGADVEARGGSAARFGACPRG